MRGFRTLKQLFMTFSFSDLVDILVISVIIYYLMKLVKETRAEQLIKGIIFLLLMAFLSDLLHLYTVNWLLTQILSVGLIFIVIVFQPEIRRAFERIGRSQGLFFSLKSNNNEEDPNTNRAVEEIVRAVSSLSRQKIGALIVLEGKTGLNDILESGTELDAEISAELLIQIFIPNTPLHDGAVVVRDNRIKAASVFLPLTQNKSLSKELGTRHRAALGVSEVSDALIIVVSEETGIISSCKNGKIARRLDTDTLRSTLNDFYNNKGEKTVLARLFSNKSKEDKEDEEKKEQQEESSADEEEKEQEKSESSESEEEEKISLEKDKEVNHGNIKK